MLKLKSNLPLVLAVAVSTAVTLSAAAQVTSGGQSAASDVIPLKVDVVFSHLQGTKKVSSMPYTLTVSAIPMSPQAMNNPGSSPSGQTTSLRLGVDVYTGRTTGSASDGKTSSMPEYQYIGTNIDCRADYRTAGAYRLYLNVSDTSLVTPAAGQGDTSLVASVGAGVRRFLATNVLSIRDGQSSQFTVGTDPVSGETIRVDVTVSALK
jgi:hypothetical protein